MAEIILAEKTVAFAERDGGIYSDDEVYSDAPIELVAGETYIVIWDGTQYECVAEVVAFVDGNEVEIGNTSILGMEDDTGEPFVLGYDPDTQMNLIYTSSNAESHTIAIYKGTLEEETPAEPAGANIVLYDRNGNPVTYEGIETVTFNTDTDGQTATYTHGTAVDEEPVTLDFSAGNQTVKPTDADMMKKAVIQKPEGLAPENIKKGIEIAGITGEMIGTGVSKEVELNLADGDQTVQADPETLMSEVVIKKPDGLVPENIAEGVTVAGVEGNAALMDFDTSDSNLEYFGYHLDIQNKEVVVRDVSTSKMFSAFGSNSIRIPDKLGGYNVAIDVMYKSPNYSAGFLSNYYTKDISIGNNVRYVNGIMSNLFPSSSNVNSLIHIPNGVTNIDYMAYYCGNFNQPINIPDSVTSMCYAVARCNNFNQPVQIGSGVVNMFRSFHECNKFNHPTTVGNCVVNMAESYQNCGMMNQPIDIPDSVVNMQYAYGNCYRLNNQNITIGNGAKVMNSAFYGCTNISGNMIIKSKNIVGLGGLINGKSNAKMLNIFVHAGSETETKVKTNAYYGLYFGSTTWTEDASNNCCYNSARNVYIYNTL